MDSQDMSKKEFCSKHPEYADDYEDLCKQYDIEMDESAPFGEPSEDDQMYQDMMDAYEKGGEEALASHLKMTPEQLDMEMSEYGRDHNLHMDDDRDEVIQGYVEELINNRDRKEYESVEETSSHIEEIKKLAGI